MSSRLKLPLLAIGLLVTLTVFYVAYSAVNTLGQLDAIERERDRWQNPQQILAALDLRDGETVVDFGSGAGYFALKLAPLVGPKGRVVAVDLRGLSLFFLAVRARLKGHRSIETVQPRERVPELGSSSADAILVCNTYHELPNPDPILKEFFRSLRPNGRLVIVDRLESADSLHGTLTPEDVSLQLKKNGFQIVERRDTLLTSPDGVQWWIIAATRPI
jgi:ubiquinone/menaquinone biosynthesis C-methylase UbiE